MKPEKINSLIKLERDRQDRLFPEWRLENKPNKIWCNLALEELGEIAKNINEEESPIVEMIQLTALMLAWLEVFEWKKE